MMMDYDPEVPAGYSDADLEQRELEAIGSRVAAARRAGVCLHGWTGPGDTPGSRRCLEDGCGRSWASEAEHLAEYGELVAVWL